MIRTLSQRSTAELSALFDEWQKDPAKLRVLLHELEFRDRPKAIRLRERVEQTLKQGSGAPEVIPVQTELPISDQNCATQFPEPPKSRTAPRASLEKNESQQREQGETSHYTKFTLVQPRGVSGRPTPYRPEMLNDVRLNLSPSDPLVKRYRIALSEWIAEMKRKKSGYRQFTLEGGELVNTDGGSFSYQFDFAEDANLFEGAKVELLIDGRLLTGSATGVVDGRIIITVADDFGSEIRICILRIDNTALIQALHDRLQKIENGEFPSFRSDFATNVIKNDGSVLQPGPLSSNEGNQLNEEQRRFVSVALANEISWLWGPPGTGKTATLTVLTQLLYEGDKRVLICSNTNRAVDQVILKLCEKMSKTGDPALNDGRVVRLGRIAKDSELERNFSDVVTIEGIVARKSQELQLRKGEIERLLQRLQAEVTDAEAALRRFKELDGAEAKLTAAKNALSNFEARLTQAVSATRNAASARAAVREELAKWTAAGPLRRVLLRSEANIRRDMANADDQLTKCGATQKEMQNAVEQCQETLLQAEAAVSRSRFSVTGLNRGTLQQRVDECNQKRQPIQTELAQIESDLRQIEEAVLKEARVVGATITRTYLRPTEFAAFDAVIIDEASMILLPSVFYAAGLATERVVITGDFRQLPPIIQTEQKAIHDILGPDIFEVSGITKAVNADRTPPRLVMLKQQYRMDHEICHHISHTFYRDKLVTATNRTEQRPPLPEPFAQRVTIIDTSSVWPFTTRNIFQSRFNLMHALAIRNLISYLRDSQCTEDSDGKPLVGLCTPYAAQAKLLNQVIDSSVPDLQINASTAHGFQGDERSAIVLDLVDSIGERNVGVFLQAENIDETGAKLLNVALSRAKEAIIIVANLTFLDARLPGKAILRELLYEFQRSGRIVDVRDVLALKPIIQDLRRFGPQPSIDPEALRTGLFAGKDFDRIARLDMQQAKKSIVIFSGFITPDRVASIGELLRCKIAEGVRVRCVTRPPQRNGSIPEELGRSALDALEGMGAIVDLRSDIHEKVVLVDGQVAWFGSLNPLSHTFRTSELMARIEDPGFAKYLSDLLSIRHRTSDDSEADATVAENPRCEKCGDRTILYRGHFGLFFGCASSACDWKRSVDSAAQTSSRTEKEPKVFSDEKASNQKCPKCGAPVKQRNGRFGIFYSCSRYPQCDGKLDNKPRNTKKTRRN